MLNILKSDFYKLKKSRAFWICAILSVLFAAFFVTSIQTGKSIAQKNPDLRNHKIVEMAEAAEGITGASSLALVLPMGFNIILVGVFVAIFVSSEFTNGTIKNTLSRGAERAKVFFSKFIVCGTASLIMLIAFIFSMLTAGSFAWGFDPTGTVTFVSILGLISLQMIIILAYTALFTFISMTMRSNGGAMATNIICVLMVSMLLIGVSILFGGKIDLSEYWLEWALSKLAVLSPSSGDIVQGMLIAFGWIIASLIAGVTLFKKQDVK
jgi:ABC-2 type transport system permease protein